jgi:endonuclease YncB( thermonuclease family)
MTRKLTWIATQILLLLLLGVRPCTGQQPFTGLVSRVVDGDMIHVQRDNEPEKVRLEGIDAPEMGQSFGPKAREVLMKKILARTVTVKPTGTDKYGRTLAVVWIDDRNINLEMVAEGWAWHFKKYSQDTALAAAENNARTQRRGLWADANPESPWDWRAAEKKRRKEEGVARATADPSVPALPPKAKPELTAQSSSNDSRPEDQESRTIVYLAPTGKHYHSIDCADIAKGSKAISLADAKKKGYRACPKCGSTTTTSESPIVDTDSDLARETGSTIYTGPRGGRYHYSSSGKKVYERRR